VSPEDLLWDNWIVRWRGDALYHRFSLSAPGDISPSERHRRARILHWTSPDLGTWSPAGTALELGETGGFDDGAHWSGCALDLGDRLALFFTGVRIGPGMEQSIGAAFSQDGRRFIKDPEPVLAPDAGPGYDLSPSGGIPMAWRDPFVFEEPGSGRRRMVFSAKRTGGRACVGAAEALDESLTRWKALPPLDLPAEHAQIEVPSVISHGGTLYCLINTTDAASDDPREARFAVRAYRAGSIAGPWAAAAPDGGLVLGPEAGIYALTPFQRKDGSWAAPAFKTDGKEDAFRWAGPFSLDLRAGRLSVVL